MTVDRRGFITLLGASASLLMAPTQLAVGGRYSRCYALSAGARARPQGTIEWVWHCDKEFYNCLEPTDATLSQCLGQWGDCMTECLQSTGLVLG